MKKNHLYTVITSAVVVSAVAFSGYACATTGGKNRNVKPPVVTVNAGGSTTTPTTVNLYRSGSNIGHSTVISQNATGNVKSVNTLNANSSYANGTSSNNGANDANGSFHDVNVGNNGINSTTVGNSNSLNYQPNSDNSVHAKSGDTTVTENSSNNPSN